MGLDPFFWIFGGVALSGLVYAHLVDLGFFDRWL